MRKYSSKPQTVEAIQFTKKNQNEVVEMFAKNGAYADSSDKKTGLLVIPTPNGRIIANFGDFIVQHPNGTIEAKTSEQFKSEYDLFKDENK